MNRRPGCRSNQPGREGSEKSQQIANDVSLLHEVSSQINRRIWTQHRQRCWLRSRIPGRFRCSDSSSTYSTMELQPRFTLNQRQSLFWIELKCHPHQLSLSFHQPERKFVDQRKTHCDLFPFQCWSILLWRCWESQESRSNGWGFLWTRCSSEGR